MNVLSEWNVISEDCVRKTFELSDSIEEKVYSHDKSSLKYGVIKNFYKDPVAVREFFKQFPLISKKTSLSPGIQFNLGQQANDALEDVYLYLREVLNKNNFPGVDNDIKCRIPEWHTYLNYYWKGMKSKPTDFIPHMDLFNYGFNIWLSEGIQEGTKFYSCRYRNYEPFYNFQQFIKNVDRETFDEFHDEFMMMYQGENIDLEFEEYLETQTEYNSATYYPGIFFHKPGFNIKENFLRFSQVSYCQFNPLPVFGEIYDEWVGTPSKVAHRRL